MPRQARRQPRDPYGLTALGCLFLVLALVALGILASVAVRAGLP